MDELKPGTVVEGRGGKRYVYKGGDRKSKDSWAEFTPEASKGDPSMVSKGLSGLDSINQLAGEASKYNPLYQVAKRSTDAAKTLGELVEKGAYNVGGEVTDFTGSPEAGYVANVATQAIPSILSGSAVKHTADSILKPAGSFMMRSALKPQMDAARNAAAVETMLKEGVNVTPAGAATLGKKVSDLSDQVDEIVAAAERAGVTINKFEVAKYGDDAIREFTKQVTPQSDVSTIKKALNQFLSHPSLKLASDQIPIQLAQDLKKGTYKALGSKPYGETSGASDYVQKSLARGLKEKIEQAAPEVAPLNKKQQEFLNALEPLSARVEVAGRKNPMGIGSIAIESDPLAAAAFQLDRSELFKSVLGRFLYNAAPSILRDTTRLGVGMGMSMTGTE